MVEINVNMGWCKPCYICVELCPKKLWSVDDKGYPFLTDGNPAPDTCARCLLCEQRCPMMAIDIEKKD
jgi:NAD-dependent dihydropyrimidine dehydrogenase PreA subunit